MDWQTYTSNPGSHLYEAFAIRDGYFSRQSLCDEPHATLLEACVCAGILSTGLDMRRYQQEVEIVTFPVKNPNLFEAGTIRVVTTEEVTEAISKQRKKLSENRRRSFSATRTDSDENCPEEHETIIEVATCEGIFFKGRGFSPCEDCSTKTIGVFTETICTRHSQQVSIVDVPNNHTLSPYEIEMGIEIALLSEGAIRQIEQPALPPPVTLAS